MFLALAYSLSRLERVSLTLANNSKNLSFQNFIRIYKNSLKLFLQSFLWMGCLK